MANSLNTHFRDKNPLKHILYFILENYYVNSPIKTLNLTIIFYLFEEKAQFI